MNTRTFTLSHFSLIGFDGKSMLWEDFPFLTIFRCPINGTYRPAEMRGSKWHLPFTPTKEARVTSEFRLGEKSVVELYGKRFVAWTNFGFDQKVLAFSIIGIEGEELSSSILTNSVKIYTTEKTTKEFLTDSKLFG